MILSIICAILSGTTSVISRSVNSCLSQKTDAYQGTFFNYFTGFITSMALYFIMSAVTHDNISLTKAFDYPYMLIGSMIGVMNILILNIVVKKISPVSLTLITFVAQSLTGVIIDYFIFGIFSFKIILGCMIVIIGLFLYNTNTKNHVSTQ